MENMLDGSGLDCMNYTGLLKGWSSRLATPSALNLGAGGRVYGTDAAVYRSYLVDTKGWTITGDFQDSISCLTPDSAGSDACLPFVGVSLDSSCQTVVSLSLLKSVYPAAHIQVWDTQPLNGDTIDGSGIWDYVLLAANDSLLCRGQIKAERKANPVLHQLFKGRDESDRQRARTPVPTEDLPLGVEYDKSSGLINEGNPVAAWCDSLFIIDTVPHYYRSIDPRSWQDSTYRYFTGYPVFVDACGQAVTCQMQVKDTYTNLGCQPDGVYLDKILRTFTVSDCNGSSSSVVQEIYLRRPMLVQAGFVGNTNTSGQAATYASAAGIVLGDSTNAPFELLFDTTGHRRYTRATLLAALKGGDYPNRVWTEQAGAWRVQPKYIFADSLSNDSSDRYAYFPEALGSAHYNPFQTFGNLGWAAQEAGRVVHASDYGYNFSIDILSESRDPAGLLNLKVAVKAIDYCTGKTHILDYLLLREYDGQRNCPGYAAALEAVSDSVCTGGDAAFRVAFSGGEAPYQLRYRVGGLERSFTQSAPGAVLSFSTSRSDSVTLLSAVDAFGCAAAIPQPGLRMPLYPLDVPGTLSDTEVCVGATATLRAAPAETGTYTYQWQQRPSEAGAAWSNIPAAQGASYTVQASQAGKTEYRAQVQDLSGGCSGASSPLLLAVQAQAAVALESSAPAVCVGGSPVVRATVQYAGQANLSYTWQSASPGSGGWTTLSEQGDSIAPVYSVPGTRQYRLAVRPMAAGCALVSSAPLFVEYVAPPRAEIQLSDPVVCAGGSSVLSYQVAKPLGNLHSTWQSASDGRTWKNLLEDSSPISVTARRFGSTYYRLLLRSDAPGCTDATVSDTAVLRVANPATPVLAAAAATVCADMPVVLQASGGDALLEQAAWRWDRSADGQSWQELGSSEAPTWKDQSSTYGTWYYRVRYQPGTLWCAELPSEAIRVTHTDSLRLRWQVSADSLCIGQSAYIQAELNGRSEGSFSWQQRPEGGAWRNVLGATGPGYTYTPTASGTRYFRVRADVAVNSGCNTPVSEPLAMYSSDCAGGLAPGVWTPEVSKSAEYGQPLLFQNIPNPFEGETRIRFYLPAPMWIRLHIQDMTGRVVAARTGMYEAGTHEWLVAASVLGAPGMYSYSLQTDAVLLSRRMVWVE